MSSIDIVAYADEHFEGVSTLWQEAFPNDQSWNNAANAIPAKLAFQPGLFFVGLDGNRVIGSIMAGYDGHRGWVNRIAVLQSHQGRGVGSALMREAETRLRTMGCTKINLQVRTSNAAAAEFYERLGYSVEDRISMSKRIAAD
jgi:ribosomal protein S18 acetylase RimI-like enzyme